MPLLFLLSQALEPVPESSNGHRMGFAPSPGPDRSSHRDEGEILPRISVRSESLTAGSPHQQDLPLRGIRRRSHRSGTTHLEPHMTNPQSHLVKPVTQASRFRKEEVPGSGSSEHAWRAAA